MDVDFTTDKTSVLDIPFEGIGLDDIESVPEKKQPSIFDELLTNNAEQPSIFDDPPMTEKEKQAEIQRQHDNLKRIGWALAKAGAVILTFAGEALTGIGNAAQNQGKRADSYLDKVKPKKENLKKDVEMVMGIHIPKKKEK